jgi:hypothetical protein
LNAVSSTEAAVLVAAELVTAELVTADAEPAA